MSRSLIRALAVHVGHSLNLRFEGETKRLEREKVVLYLSRRGAEIVAQLSSCSALSLVDHAACDGQFNCCAAAARESALVQGATAGARTWCSFILRAVRA